MHQFWEPVVEPLLERLEPKVIVEVGSGQGLQTRNLLAYCDRVGATLHAVDPAPGFAVDQWLGQHPDSLVFHRAPGLEVLASIEVPHLVLLDGDANWHTAFYSLRSLAERAESESKEYPVVLVHNVAWPHGRRDWYREPNRVPEPDRNPSARGGLRPGWEGLDSRGGLQADSVHARTEGGPRNGVMTAVEDFLRWSQVSLEVVTLPVLGGLAIIYPSSLGMDSPVAAKHLAELRASDASYTILRDVDAKRLSALAELADAQVDLTAMGSSVDDLRAEIQRTERSDFQKIRSLEESLKDADSAKDEVTEKLAALQAELADAEAKAAHAGSERDSLLASDALLQQQVAAWNSQYDALRTRRSVRLALGVARLASPLIRLLRRTAPHPDAELDEEALEEPESPRLGPVDQAALADEITKRRPGSQRTDGPLVSIVILTRNGAAQLANLLARLEYTEYRSFEVIVVDNGSTDSTAAILDVVRTFPVRAIRNEANASFSVGNQQGADLAAGEYLLFMNNDIEPMGGGWLGALVDAIESGDDIVAAGAVLVYPVRDDRDSDLTVQHRAVRLGFRKGAVHAFNVGELDPLDEVLAGIVDVPAATAATLLVRGRAYEEVGGFSNEYVYGTEDVDLCLKLSRLGRIVVTGQATLFHNESATQTEIGTAISQINRAGNWQRFTETWAPRASRSVMRDKLAGSGRWTEKGDRIVAITLTHDDPAKGWGDFYTAHELGAVFSAAGWEVVYAERHGDRWYEIDQDVDLWISLLDAFDSRKAPDGALTIAWVRNWVDRWLSHPWLESYDVVVASSHKAARLLSEGSRFDVGVVPLATNLERFVTGPVNPAFESDYAFTGNNWGVGRRVTSLLAVEPEESFLMFGLGWERDSRVARYWRGHLDHELLPELYRSTKIVLDDTASPTLPYAFLNGRVFDALAAGALVLTDNVEGSAEMFDGMLPSYSDRSELRAQLDRYLRNDDERVALVEDLRQRVVTSHSYVGRADEFLALANAYVEQPHAAIKIGVPNEEVRGKWGDSHFADALASALGQLGMPTKVHLLPEWDSAESQDVDVVIHVRGLSRYVPKPAHVNIMWLISHPDDVALRDFEMYDLVLVASRTYAEWLGNQIETPVVFMPQATDQRRFHLVASDPALANDVVFVGNSRGQRRPAIRWAVEHDLPLAVYGSGWDGLIDPSIVKAEYVPNDELAALYGSAKVVLSDHWPDMRDQGFISNRVFDALASGGVVVSDRVTGLDELFGELVPTFTDPQSLEETVRSLLADEGRRREIADAASVIVAEHTFAKRAGQIYELVRPLLRGRRRDLEGSLFGD